MNTDLSEKVLFLAAEANGITGRGSRLIRNGSHAIWETPTGIVARVGERQTADVAQREVAISRWLDRHGLRVVRVIEKFHQPTIVEGYPVTWWERLPPHRPATPAELGALLRVLHRLPLPATIELPRLAPFGTIRQKLSNADGAAWISSSDLAWIVNRLAELESQYENAVADIPSGVIHGDAWQGNIAVPHRGEPVVLDLEDFAVGPQYWDLLPVAVDHTDFARISRPEYEGFVAAYGIDVTTTSAYRTLADIQELRWTSYVIGKADYDPAAAREAAHRIACMRGEKPKPWAWSAF